MNPHTNLKSRQRAVARDRRSRAFFLAVALFLLGSVAMLIYLRVDDEHAAPGSSGPSARNDSRSPDTSRSVDAGDGPERDDPARWLGYRAGDSMRYRFSSHMTLHILHEADPGTGDVRVAGTDLSLGHEGNLQVDVLDRKDRSWTLRFRVDDAESTIGSGDLEDVVRSEDLEKGMEGDVLVAMDLTGRIDKVVLPGDMPPAARNHWRALLTQWQFIFPEDADAKKWTVSEADSTGTYMASYELEAARSGVSVRKMKTHYESVGGAKDIDLADQSRVDGEAVLELDRIPTSLEGEELLLVKPQGLGQTLEGEARFSFELSAYRNDGDLARDGRWREHFRNARGTRLGDNDRTQPHEADLPVETLDTETELAGAAKTLEMFGLESPEVAKSLSRLVALLRGDDGAAREFVERIADPTLDDDLAVLLIGALGSAATAAGQWGLEEIFAGEDFAEDRRLSALISFGRIEDPRSEVEVSLAQLYESRDPLASTSLMLMAAVGDRVRESDPVRFEAISGYVQDAVEQSSAPGELAAALVAQGNITVEEVPDAVRYAFSNEAPDVRRAAVRAVTRVEDPSTDSLLVTRARDDASEDVRAAAVEVLSAREAEVATQILEEAVRGDSSDHVRQTALTQLAPRARDDAAVRELVSWVAENDSSGDIREHARGILEGQDG